ncbi:polysaccharide deacetylase family protein [Bradyrhizobium sp. 2TAF24]|uniref:polysaccharide deacetylase family protein n=1 Tax=Bradyrhizobium sp. 2TAF24 TaxID=3233011 RepID=UPI003F9186D5
MTNIRNSIIRAGFDALYFSGAHHLLRPLLGGVGLILMLHHVRPARDDPFQPNRHLEVTPDFLRATLTHVRAQGFEIIGLDEMHRRLAAGDFERRFACFTFDDGYRDNRDHALPVMRDYDAPFTVYAAADFADGSGPLWWLALEQLVAQADTIEAPIGDGIRLDCGTPLAKTEAFAQLHGWLRGLPDDTAVRDAVDRLCRQHGIATKARGADLCLSWDELRAFAAEPLVTIGAHTLSHCNLARETETGAAREMADSRARIESELQRPARHFAYPYGDRGAATTREFALARRLGFDTAVTTRPGVLFAENATHPTALPRISLNGNYQDRRFLAVLTSGAATAMWNGFRRVDAA